MKLSWLGQAGYRITADNGTVIMIDPYMSDTLFQKKGADFTRQVAINEQMLSEHVDILILTHIHDDHMDFGTLDRILSSNGEIAILASANVLNAMRARYGRSERYMIFNPGVEITLNGILLSSVHAVHSDEAPLGVIIECDGKVLAHTGDTMYHKLLRTELPEDMDALLVPINGQGNNMNAVDAARLTKKLHPKKVFPMHWDMFKRYGCDVREFTELFASGEQEIVIPEYYKDMEI